VFAFGALAFLPAAVPALTARNSVPVPLVVRTTTGIEGVGCGTTGSSTVTLPAGVFEVDVRQPKVGASDGDVRLTDIAVQGAVVTFAVVADGAGICDPNGDVPPADRRWLASFDIEVGVTWRQTVAVRNDWENRGDAYLVRPRVVGFHFAADFADTVRKIRWTTYGGRKAVGFGILRYARAFCRSGRCPAGEGQRVRVELTRPSYCPGRNIVAPGKPIEPFVFYGSISAFNLRRIGVLEPGTNFLGYEAYKYGCNGPATRIR
jgi:hypothetical protein